MSAYHDAVWWWKWSWRGETQNQAWVSSQQARQGGRASVTANHLIGGMLNRNHTYFKFVYWISAIIYDVFYVYQCYFLKKLASICLHRAWGIALSLLTRWLSSVHLDCWSHMMHAAKPKLHWWSPGQLQQPVFCPFPSYPCQSYKCRPPVWMQPAPSQLVGAKQA